MPEIRSSAVLLAYNGEHHNVMVDDNWRVIRDDKQVLFSQQPLESAVVVDGLVRAINTVFDTKRLSTDIKNQTGLPAKIEQLEPYYLRTGIPSVIGLMIDNEEFTEFTSHLHVMGRGSGSRYMLIDDERSADTRLKVFGEYTEENKSVSNVRILEGLGALPLGEATRRTVIAKSGEVEEEKKPESSPREEVRTPVQTTSVPEVDIELFTQKEMAVFNQALSRCKHMNIAGMKPYKVIILDMIMSSGAPMSDKALKDYLKDTLGSSFSEDRAESALTSMFKHPFVGRNSRIGVHSYLQGGKPVTMFGRLVK